MIWSQRIDPKAGEWKHEILVRGLLYTLAIFPIDPLSGNLLFIDGLPVIHGVRVAELLFLAFPGLMVGIAETALRRTWRRIGFNIGLCVLSVALSRTIIGDASNSWSRGWIPYIAMGGAIGLSAGLGARNLLGTTLAFIFGQCGTVIGIALYENHYFIKGIPIPINVVGLMINFSILVPPALLSGVGVWAGCRFSKPRSGESPQPAAPGGL